MAALVVIDSRRSRYGVAVAKALCWLSLTVWVTHARAAPSLPQSRGVQKPENGDELFTGDAIRRIRVEIPPAGMAELRKYHWERGGNPDARPQVMATLREGNSVYTNVALHLKGAEGSFRPVDQNPCLTLNFDKFVPGQRFHGLEKISLNNSVEDSTFLTEKICREMFKAAGIPVPRSDYAVVELNGRPLGLYVLVEGWNKQFLRRHFKNSDGNFYDSGFIKDITAVLEKTSGPNPRDQSDLKALAAAAREPDLTTRLARLERVLDLDRFITSVALQVMMSNWDGYAMNINNYRIYHEPASDRLVMLPHGLDQMFGQPMGPILPKFRGMLARAVIEIPEGRQRYFARMSQLQTNIFDAEAITNRVKQQAVRIRPVLAEQNPQAARNHANLVARLCERIAQRAQSIDQQLSAARQPAP